MPDALVRGDLLLALLLRTLALDVGALRLIGTTLGAVALGCNGGATRVPAGVRVPCGIAAPSCAVSVDLPGLTVVISLRCATALPGVAVIATSPGRKGRMGGLFILTPFSSLLSCHL